MKNFWIIGLLLAIVSIMTTGCSSCQSENKKQDAPKEQVSIFGSDYDGVLPDLSQSAEHIIALQRQEMYNAVEGGYYVWYETKFSYSDSLKIETLDDVRLVEITSTFQTFSPNLSYTVTDNVAKGHLFPHPTPGLWIEDFDLNNVQVKLTVNDVIERLKQWNGILPPGTFIILRKPVGPQPCNAQYVIGNPFQVIFIDAVTGDVTDWNPAFPRVNVGGPLGEWP